MKHNLKRVVVVSILLSVIGTKLITAKKDAPKRHTRVEEDGAVIIGEGGTQEHEDIATDEIDLQQKQKDVRALIARGAEFCARNSLSKICHTFTHTKNFVEGELYLFLLDTKGVVYAHGEREELLWKNLWNHKDNFGAFAIQSIIKTAQAGSGWITYEWAGASKVSFVQKVEIEGKDYIIGGGYYPHSKKYAAIGLVKGAVSMFNHDIAQNRPIETSFSTMGYPLSERFIFGDLYLYALDFNGNIRAQGDDPGLIGINVLERKDAQGKAINKEIIDKLKAKEEGEGIWIEYTSKNAVKYTYAEKVKDDKGNSYFIACGYYPEIDRDKTADLVRRGYQYMKASGVSVTAKDFTDKNVNTYRLGDLFLFVYDMKGNCIAHGGNPSFLGQNQFDLKDQDGVYYIREFIDQAKAGGGWVDAKLENSFQSTYVEKIDMGVDSYVIGASMFPVAKPETMTLLVKSGVGYLQTHSDDQSFETFTSPKGGFIRGDLSIIVLDLDGYCYAWGSEYEVIWKNIIDWKDDEGKAFIKQMIDKSMQGACHFVYKFNKKIRVDYCEQVEKGDKKYLICSGFYK
jgi:cytochrome c